MTRRSVMSESIQIVSIDATEAKLFNQEARAAYWSKPISLSVVILSIVALAHWIFSIPWFLAWWLIGGVFLVFILIRLFKRNRTTVQPGMAKVIRKGVVVNSECHDGRTIEITLGHLPTPEGYPDFDMFIIWRASGMPYYLQEKNLDRNHNRLLGQEVVIEYLANTGAVLAFNELNPMQNPLLVGEQVNSRFGTVHVIRSNGHNESIAWQDVDYVAIYSLTNRKPNTTYYLNLRSYTAMGISISSDAEGFAALERQLSRRLKGFDEASYQQWKQEVGEEALTVWMRSWEANVRLLDLDSTSTVGQSAHSLARGIYLMDQDAWLEWGTFGELEATGLAVRSDTKHPNPIVTSYIYTLRAAVVGQIKLEKLQVFTPHWDVKQAFDSRWPVTNMSAEITLGGGGQTDFAVLSDHLTRVFGPANQPADSHHLTTTWTFDQLILKLYVPQFYQLDKDASICRIEITLKPDISPFFTSEYTQIAQPVGRFSHLLLTGRLSIPENYVFHPYVRYMPEELKSLLTPAEDSTDQFIVWVDRNHGVLGMGNSKYFQEINLEKFRGLQLVGEFWRDAPRCLRVYLLTHADSTPMSDLRNFLGEIYTGDDDGQWSIICQKLDALLPFPCVYVERREYY